VPASARKICEQINERIEWKMAVVRTAEEKRGCIAKRCEAAACEVDRVTMATFGPTGSIRLDCGRPPVNGPDSLIQRGCCGGRCSRFEAQAFDQP
jgi:hypothetical protein